MLLVVIEHPAAVSLGPRNALPQVRRRWFRPTGKVPRDSKIVADRPARWNIGI